MVELDSIRITADELNPTHRDTAIKTVIGGLFRRRNEYSDEIPEELRNSYSPEGIRVKVRKGGWFTGISSLAQEVIWLKLIESAGDIKELEKGIDKFTSEGFCNTNHPRITKEDIQYGNQFIDFMLDRIDPKLIQEVILARDTAQPQAFIQQVTV